MKDKRKQLKKGQITAIIAASLAIILMVVGITAAVLTKDEGYEVMLTAVETGDMTQYYSASGTIISTNNTEFSIPQGTIVSSVNVEEGDVVEKGQLLATFDTSSLSASLNEKQTAYREALKTHNAAMQSGHDAKEQLKVIQGQLSTLEREIASLQGKLKSYTSKIPKTPTLDLENILSNLEGMTVENLQMLQAKVLNEIQNAVDSSVKDLTEFSKTLSSLIQKTTEKVQLELQEKMLSTQSQISVSEITGMFVEYTKQQRDQAQQNFEKLSAGWIAPMPGLITKINIEAGQAFGGQASPEMDISSIMDALSGGGDITSMISGFMGTGNNVGMVMADPESYMVELVVGKNDIAKIQKGQKATVRVTETEMQGEVVYISPTAEGGSGSSGFDLSAITGSLTGGSSGVLVRVKILNPDASAIIGFDANVNVETGLKNDVILIPVEAISMKGNVNYIYVYNAEDETITETEVVVGSLDATSAEITKGLKKGDKIVIRLSSDLKDGMKVKEGVASKSNTKESSK